MARAACLRPLHGEAYASVEREARAPSAACSQPDVPLGVQAGTWEGAQSAAQAERARACPIKGNISSGRIRIYHLPWQRDYASTRIDEAAGERWFCDEAEAERAGWRRAAR
jgi:hypothetical protein